MDSNGDGVFTRSITRSVPAAGVNNEPATPTRSAGQIALAAGYVGNAQAAPPTVPLVAAGAGSAVGFFVGGIAGAVVGAGIGLAAGVAAQ